MKRFSLMTLASAALASGAVVQGANWPQWRGPNFDGSTDEKGLPSTWTKEGALWTADMPGASASTPVVWGRKVFVSTADNSAKSLHALCLDRQTGRALWDRTIGEGAIQRDEKSDFASSSPAADGDRVFFFYSDGTLVGFDHDGKQIWTRSVTRDFGEFAYQWTFASSPLLYDGRLYVQVLQRDSPVHGHGRTDGPIESYLLAVNPADGKTLWRKARPTAAVAESMEAYSTPMPYAYKGRKEILIAGGDCLTGSDAQSGDELWRWGTWNPQKIGHWRLVVSPVAGGGVVLACAPKGDPIYAIKVGESGQLDPSPVAWKSDSNRALSTDVPTPLFYEHDFFVLGDGKRTLSRVDPATGTVKWSVELPGRKKIESSPTGGDGKVYVMNFAGDVTVVEAASGAILGTVAMGDPGDDMTRSSVVISQGALFIRTNHKLYSVGKK